MQMPLKTVAVAISISIALPLLTVALSLSAEGAPAKAKAASSSTSYKKAFVSTRSQRMSPTQSGVKLLEDILQRLHETPQIAITKVKQALAYQAQNAATFDQKGPTNMMLAIKPKESVNFRNAKTIEYDALGRGLIAQNESSQADHGITEYASNSPAKARARFNFAPQSYPAEAAKKAEQLKASQPRLSAESERRLSSSLNKFYGLNQQLSTAMKRADGAVASEKPGSRAEPRARAKDKATIEIADAGPGIKEYGKQSQFGSVLDEHKALQVAAGGLTSGGAGGAAPTANGYVAPVRGALKARDSQIALGAPALVPKGASDDFADTDAVARQESGNLQSAQQAPAAQAVPAAPAQPLLAPRQPSLFRIVRDLLPKEETAPPVDVLGGKSASIAMLPPSVVSGIPFVRLGSSAYEVNKALKPIGALNRQTIDGWDVWTVTRPHANGAALHVYMRHGLVEAIRIYDASLVTPDFGVQLGDDLPTLKKRFGQPSFIISEPHGSASGADRNYVYPLSQVCFQLARDSGRPEPRVVSVLIFTVK